MTDGFSPTAASTQCISHVTHRSLQTYRQDAFLLCRRDSNTISYVLCGIRVSQHMFQSSPEKPRETPSQGSSARCAFLDAWHAIRGVPTLLTRSPHWCVYGCCLTWFPMARSLHPCLCLPSPSATKQMCLCSVVYGFSVLCHCSSPGTKLEPRGRSQQQAQGHHCAAITLLSDFFLVPHIKQLTLYMGTDTILHYPALFM